jgi:hypothetical protein
LIALVNVYVTLYGYQPGIKATVDKALEAMRSDQENMFSELEYDSQNIIRQADLKQVKESPIVLGDKLRGSIAEIEQRHKDNMDSALTDIRAKLNKVVTSTDDELLKTQPRSR